MTNNEIIKVLKCCVKGDCYRCPRQKQCGETDLTELALDLINRQKAELDNLKRDTIPKLEDSLKRANKYGLEVDRENEKLKAEIERLKSLEINVYETVNELRNKIKSEAYKEFAERLKNEIAIRTTHSKEQDKLVFFYIDNLVKEMAGEG